MKKSDCFTMTFTTKSAKSHDIALQGLYTTRNTFCMRVSNPCATYILSMVHILNQFQSIQLLYGPLIPILMLIRTWKSIQRRAARYCMLHLTLIVCYSGIAW